jgi:hypothetical protein
MVSLSIIGMTGWVNPLHVAVRRPGTLSVARRRSAGAFFCGTARGFDGRGCRRGAGGARWSAAARDAPGRPTRHPPARTSWLQVPWGRRARCTPRPSAAHRPRVRIEESPGKTTTKIHRGTASRRGGSARRRLLTIQQLLMTPGGPCGGTVASAMRPYSADRGAGGPAALTSSRTPYGRWHLHSLLSEAASARWCVGKRWAYEREATGRADVERGASPEPVVVLLHEGIRACGVTAKGVKR